MYLNKMLLAYMIYVSSLGLVKQPQFLDSASSAAAPSALKVGESSLSDSSPSMRSPQSHTSPAQQTALKVTHGRTKRLPTSKMPEDLVRCTQVCFSI